LQPASGQVSSRFQTRVALDT